jgi:hypothetical protein
MKGMSLSADDAVLARLQAPPDLHEGTEALAYWRGRQRRLPWYRFGARREAARMTLVWERRVRAAAIGQRGLPTTALLRAGQLIAATWFRRFTRRVVLAVAVTTALVVAVLVIPAVLVLDLLIRALF